MKNRITIKYLAILAMLVLGLQSCSEDEGLTSVEAAAPSNIDAAISITQDNSGEVTILPTGENANLFYIDYGDGSALSDTLASGNQFTHMYAEGEYDVTVVGLNIAGDKSEVIKPLTVSFRAPENLDVSITKDANDPFSVSVSATADFAAGFQVTFGENQGESPVEFGIGESVEYTYSDVGDFEITVIALSGGVETTSYSEMVSITDPLVFPIDFESETVDYTFNNFGGGEGDGVPIIDNPDPNSVNNSAKVASYTKVSGSQTWAGTSAALNEPIDFSQGTVIEMDVYSPTAGTPVLFKIENADDSNIFMEVTQNTTTSGEWETLSFDFSSVDVSQDYSIVAVFFNFNTPGTGETYYFDNIRLTQSFTATLPLDFESPASTYPFTEFGGMPVSIEANPDQSGINTSSQVAKALKANGAGPFAGAFIDLDTPIDFSSSTTISMKVWSPTANLPVLLKLEDPNDSSVAMEIQGTVTQNNTWTEVSFDFSGIDASQNWGRIIVFFNFGNPGTGTEYYFDDIMLSN